MLLVLKIIGGVLIPSLGAIIFNMLQLVVDANESGDVMQVGASSYDVAIGCTLALFGIGVGATDSSTSRMLVTTAVILLLATVAVEIVGPIFFELPRLRGIVTMDALSMMILALGIWITD